jgi:phosphoribosylanthranilate isomerase
VALVKICGINSAEAMDAACAAGADWIGFVFAPTSPRAVTPDQAEALSGRNPGGPLRVGLFVDPSDDDIEAALEAVPLDVLQLYADPERAGTLRQSFGIAVWRAICPADLPRPPEPIDGYVIEPAPPRGARLPGGNGAGLDPALLRDRAPLLPWLLAGGLTPGNVAAAIIASGATAVDVSSGVERARGVKDAALIAAFVRNARLAAA